jgi:transcription initiation factor TFIID/TFIIF subunit
MVLTDVSGKDHAITHDLNFHNNRYEVKQVITFKNPKAPLLGALRGSGPVPGDTATDAGVNGASSSKKRQSGANETQKRKKLDTKGIDMDKLAEGLQKLGEDDLLLVVQMVHDNKSDESWMRNDVDRKSLHSIYIILWREYIHESGSLQPFSDRRKPAICRESCVISANCI